MRIWITFVAWVACICTTGLVAEADAGGQEQLHKVAEVVDPGKLAMSLKQYGEIFDNLSSEIANGRMDSACSSYLYLKSEDSSLQSLLDGIHDISDLNLNPSAVVSYVFPTGAKLTQSSLEKLLRQATLQDAHALCSDFNLLGMSDDNTARFKRDLGPARQAVAVLLRKLGSSPAAGSPGMAK